MNLFTRWKEKASEFIDVRVGLLKLSLIERTSTLLGNLMLSFIYLFIALAILTFLGFGLMETFAELLGSRVGGAFTTAGVFVLMLLLLFAARKAIIRGFAGIFIRILTDSPDDDDSEDSKKVTVEGE
jgi:hypothetical protein